ncbi:hypothetical protein HK104_008004 [Borealophlyctis nickersoniae]|nr:hypothetical protein HK104_008004 [Borealophlyctis nickersoniae]
MYYVNGSLSPGNPEDGTATSPFSSLRACWDYIASSTLISGAVEIHASGTFMINTAARFNASTVILHKALSGAVIVNNASIQTSGNANISFEGFGFVGVFLAQATENSSLAFQDATWQGQSTFTAVDSSKVSLINISVADSVFAASVDDDSFLEVIGGNFRNNSRLASISATGLISVGSTRGGKVAIRNVQLLENRSRLFSIMHSLSTAILENVRIAGHICGNDNSLLALNYGANNITNLVMEDMDLGKDGCAMVSLLTTTNSQNSVSYSKFQNFRSRAFLVFGGGNTSFSNVLVGGGTNSDITKSFVQVYSDASVMFNNLTWNSTSGGWKVSNTAPARLNITDALFTASLDPYRLGGLIQAGDYAAVSLRRPRLQWMTFSLMVCPESELRDPEPALKPKLIYQGFACSEPCLMFRGSAVLDFNKIVLKDVSTWSIYRYSMVEIWTQPTADGVIYPHWISDVTIIHPNGPEFGIWLLPGAIASVTKLKSQDCTLRALMAVGDYEILPGVSSIPPAVTLDQASFQGAFSDGAILQFTGNVTISNSTFYNINGRGIYLTEGQMVISNSSFISNTNAADDGAAIYVGNATGLRVLDTVFKGNRARRGAGIWSADITTLCAESGNTYINNTASSGHGNDRATAFKRFQLVSTDGSPISLGPIEIYSGDTLPALSYGAVDLYNQIVAPQPTDRILIGGTRITNSSGVTNPSQVTYQGQNTAFLSGIRSYPGATVLGTSGTYQLVLAAIADDGISYSDNSVAQPVVIKECTGNRTLVETGFGGLPACQPIVCNRGCDLKRVGNGVCTAPDVCSCKPGQEGITCDLPADTADTITVYTQLPLTTAVRNLLLDGLQSTILDTLEYRSFSYDSLKNASAFKFSILDKDTKLPLLAPSLAPIANVVALQTTSPVFGLLTGNVIVRESRRQQPYLETAAAQAWYLGRVGANVEVLLKPVRSAYQKPMTAIGAACGIFNLIVMVAWYITGKPTPAIVNLTTVSTYVVCQSDHDTAFLSTAAVVAGGFLFFAWASVHKVRRDAQRETMSIQMVVVNLALCGVLALLSIAIFGGGLVGLSLQWLFVFLCTTTTLIVIPGYNIFVAFKPKTNEMHIAPHVTTMDYGVEMLQVIMKKGGMDTTWPWEHASVLVREKDDAMFIAKAGEASILRLLESGALLLSWLINPCCRFSIAGASTAKFQVLPDLEDTLAMDTPTSGTLILKMAAARDIKVFVKTGSQLLLKTDSQPHLTMASQPHMTMASAPYLSMASQPFLGNDSP